jgi:hypothetical protein
MGLGKRLSPAANNDETHWKHQVQNPDYLEINPELLDPSGFSAA